MEHAYGNFSFNVSMMLAGLKVEKDSLKAERTKLSRQEMRLKPKSSSFSKIKMN